MHTQKHQAVADTVAPKGPPLTYVDALQLLREFHGGRGESLRAPWHIAKRGAFGLLITSRSTEAT